MKNALIIFCLFLCIQIGAEAQCPPSNQAGIHVVQPDENLFRISLKYGISVKKLCALNNMRETDLLPACKKLRVGDAGTQSTSINTGSSTTSTSTSASGILKRQAGNRHVVQLGETAAGLARLYGYTEERFREFNAMGNDRLTPGSIVLSHDCACDRVMFSENASPTTGTEIAGNYNPETTTYYEPTNPTRVKHKPLSTSEIGNQPTAQPGTSPAAENPNTTNTSPSTGNSNTSKAGREAEMINEINLLRSNPSGYMKYVNEYVADQKANNGFPVDQAVVDELGAELRALQALSQLKPKECVYVAAKKHGQDMLKMGRTDHIGSDGKWPWDRVRRECPDLQDGNENLVGGPSSVRESVIILLIDEGIPSRGHRKTLLRSDWVYVACYEIGQIGMMPNCWVQKFGF